MKKWVRKHEDTFTSTWGADWSYILLTHSIADYWVIKKEFQHLLSMKQLPVYYEVLIVTIVKERNKIDISIHNIFSERKAKLKELRIDTCYDSWIFIVVNQMSWEHGPW